MAHVFSNIVRTRRKSLSTGQRMETQSISDDMCLLSRQECFHCGLSSLWAWASPSLWSRRDWDSCSPCTWILWLSWLAVCDRDLWERSLSLSPSEEGSLAYSLRKISLHLPAEGNSTNTQLDSIIMALRRQMALDMKLCATDHFSCKGFSLVHKTVFFFLVKYLQTASFTAIEPASSSVSMYVEGAFLYS